MVENTPLSFTIRSQAFASRRTSNSDPLRASTVYRRRSGHRRGAVLRRQITVLSSTAIAATSSQLHVSSLCRTELPQCQYSVGLCQPTWRMGKSERRPFIRYRNNVATVIQRAAVCIDRQLDAYPRSLPIAVVRPVQHPAALCLTRRPPTLHPCIFSPTQSPSTAVASSSSSANSQLS